MRMIFDDFLFRIPRLLLTVVQILRFQSWLPKRLSNNSFGQVGPLCILVDFDHLKYRLNYRVSIQFKIIYR